MGGGDLEVAELRELLVAGLETAAEGFGAFVHDFVGADVPALGESFAAVLAVVGFFAGVAAFVGLGILCISITRGEGGVQKSNL